MNRCDQINKKLEVLLPMEWMWYAIGVQIITLPLVLCLCGMFFFIPLNVLTLLPILFFGWFCVVVFSTAVARKNFLSLVGVQILIMALGYLFGSMLVCERYAEFRTIDYGPDDTIYVETAIDLAQDVREQPLALWENWEKLGYDFSLRGYSFLRAYLFAWLPFDFDLWYLAAVALNQIALCLLFISLYHAVMVRHGSVKLFPLLMIYICVCMNLFIHSSQCLKDVILTLFLSVACLNCVPCIMAHGRIRVLPVLLLVVATLGLLTFRAVYVVLPVIYFVLLNFNTLKKMRFVYFVTALVLTGAVFAFFYAHDFQIRKINLLNWTYGGSELVLSSGGLAYRIYKIPLIGPMLYYLLIPFPFFDFHITPFRTGLINLAWFFYVPFLVLIIANIWNIVRCGRLLPIFVFCIIFLFMTDVGGQILDDTSARYKFPVMPFLCVIVYSLIVKRKIGNNIPA